MEKWKQKNGPKATYDSLIRVFEQAGCLMYAEVVKRIYDREKMIQQSFEVTDDWKPLSPPPMPQPSTYPKHQSPQFPSTPEPSESFVLVNEAGNSSKG